MTTILVVSDDGISSGYGRISMEVNTRLVKRGYHIHAFSLAYDGLLPPVNDGAPLPYWVGAGGGKPNWVECVVNLIHAIQPDIVMVIQDAPYLQAIRTAPIDWSRYAFIGITPVDGVPVYGQWVEFLKQADAVLSISQFGVDAYRRAGVQATLCRPGIDPNRFFQLSDEQRLALRTKIGLHADNFIIGSMCMNQGRKAIPQMLRGFDTFAKDKPEARYLMDMDKVSPAGWDILELCRQFHLDTGKLLFREDVARAGILDLRERYNLLDAHMVISHREGYGIPLAEAQACGVVSIALNYCSGSEICGIDDETNLPRGVLIMPIKYSQPSTWGGALDMFPDMNHLVNRLQWLYDHPHERLAIAERGMAWSRRHTWDESADSVGHAIQKVMKKRAALPAPQTPLHVVQSPVIAPMPQGVDGVKPVELVEAR